MAQETGITKCCVCMRAMNAEISLNERKIIKEHLIKSTCIELYRTQRLNRGCGGGQVRTRSQATSSAGETEIDREGPGGDRGIQGRGESERVVGAKAQRISYRWGRGWRGESRRRPRGDERCTDVSLSQSERARGTTGVERNARRASERGTQRAMRMRGESYNIKL